MEGSHYGPRLSALVGLLCSAFPLEFQQDPGAAGSLLGVEMSRGAFAAIRQRLSATLAEPMAQALAYARQQPVGYVDKTGALLCPCSALPAQQPPPAPTHDRHPAPAGPPGKLGGVATRFLGIAPEPARHG